MKQNLPLSLSLTPDRSVMHISQGILKGYFKVNPFRQQKLKIFAKEAATFDCLILNYNSPLGRPKLQNFFCLKSTDPYFAANFNTKKEVGAK